MQNVNLAQAMPPNARRTRRPSHPFHNHQEAFQITPNLIAPVMPGESLKSALFQAKAVTPPVSADLIGWHAEQYIFYVKLTDLDDREAFRDMVVDPTYDATAIDATADDLFTFFAAKAGLPGVNYVEKCLERVISEYFRDEDEAVGAATIGGKYIAKITHNSLADSLRLTSAYEAADVDFDVDLDADATITASEVSKAQQMWSAMIHQGLTDKSYEDFLKSYGIRPDETTEAHRPELLRYVRDWSYPTRLTDPATGTPTSAVQWSMQEQINKARFFKEPGFIFGVSVFRPKVYLNQQGSLTAFLQNGLQWLPGEVMNNVAFGLENFAASTGPFDNITSPYTLDLRDLMLYGEQYVNIVTTGTTHNVADSPNAAGAMAKYITEAQANFIVPGADKMIKSDGIFNLSIASHLAGDLTPSA